MITMNIYRKIKKCKSLGQTTTSISQELGLARNTVAKYLTMTVEEYLVYKKKRSCRTKKFDSIKDEVIELVKNILRKKPNTHFYMASVYDFLEEKYSNLPGSERSFRNYIQFLIENGDLEKNAEGRLYQPVDELPFGKQMQLDFGEIKISLHEKVYIFGALLSSSRFKYSVVQGKPFKAIDVIKHLLNCFEYFGGIPEQLVIDQDSTMVVSENNGDLIFTKQFDIFIAEMDIKMFVCRKSDPESKGKVENFIGFIKKSFFNSRSFSNADGVNSIENLSIDKINEINQSMLLWLNRKANGKISQATGHLPADLIEKEREKLRPLRASIFNDNSFLKRSSRKVSAESLISVKSCKYSVFYEYNHQEVWVSFDNDKLLVYASSNSVKIIAEHKISLFPNKKIINKNHYKGRNEKPKELCQDISNRIRVEGWSDFVQQNYSTHKRYFRDQYRLLDRFLLETKYDEKVLAEAIRFCNEIEKFSATNLKDTYTYMEGVMLDKKDNVLIKMASGIKSIHENVTDITIAKRKIEYYTSIINILGVIL